MRQKAGEKMQLTINMDVKTFDDAERDDLHDELRRIATGIAQRSAGGKILNTQGLVIGSWEVR